MPVLSRAGIQDKRAWEEANIELPQFDYDEMAAATKENPVWIHFGAGNIFRGFIAMLQQTLLNGGRARGGIVAAEGFDLEIIDRIYLPHDNLSLLVIMNSDGTMDKKVVASIGEALKADVEQEEDWRRLQEIFARPSLQMASFTITEKGYSLKDINGEYYEIVKADMARGPEKPSHIMAKIAALAYVRYKKGSYPIAFVSMDNHSRNGEKFREAVMTIAKKWAENGLVEKDFLTYLTDEARVSFPWTMIDKIVPRPSETIRDALLAAGFNGMEIICTKKNTFIAPFVNTERPQYLVIEDNFPNGRPPLEMAGVMFTDRQTVERTEQMKVCTCLNPLHTALAVFGCLLGYNLIADTLKDEQLRRLVEKIGYEEGLPVVVDPGILNPRAFIKEVIEERLPNPYIPDTPQRIVTDTSQKMGIRFGKTIRAYHERRDLDPADLVGIPLTIAGWCRYLLGWDDLGRSMPLSPDPLLPTLRSYLAEVKLGDPSSVGNSLHPILTNTNIFGLNLYEVGLGYKIEGYFKEMVAGIHAVRKTLETHLGR